MDKYFTLKGYKIRNKNKITEAMEDYIEMIYKNTKDFTNILQRNWIFTKIQKTSFLYFGFFVFLFESPAKRVRF